MELNKIVVIGDLHFSNKEPYKKSRIEFIKDLYDLYSNDILIFTGDILDKASSHYDYEIKDLVDLLKLFREVHIISGNHEANRKSIGNPLSVLNLFENINCYLEPKEVYIEDKSFLMLPYLYSFDEMKEYENIKGSYDYVISHITHPKTEFGNIDGIDLYKINAKKLYYGHIHKPYDFDNHVVLGVPLPTRYDEKDWKRRISIIEEKDYFVELKSYTTYEDVKFKDHPINKDSILTIHNASDIKSANQFYSSYYVRDIILNTNVNSETFDSQKEILNFDLVNRFKDFTESFQIEDSRVKETCYSYLTKI